MSNLYQLVVFDWEGTVADTIGQVLHTVIAEASRLNFGVVSFDEARKFVGLGLIQALKKLFPHLSLTQQEQLLQAVQQATVSRNYDICLIPGALDVIQQLNKAGVHLAIATNKGHQSLLRALQMTGLDDYFKVTRAAGQVPSKPCPQMLEEIMDEFSVQSKDTLMIGDSSNDMEMAKSITVDAIGVDFYHQTGSLLKSAGALEVFDSYSQLANYLKLPMT